MAARLKKQPGRKEEAREGREQLEEEQRAGLRRPEEERPPRGHVLFLLFSIEIVLAGPPREPTAPKPGSPDLPGDSWSPW